VIRASEDELFKIAKISLSHLNVRAIKPDALFLFGNIEHLEAFHDFSNEVAKCMSVFEQCQLKSPLKRVDLSLFTDKSLLGKDSKKMNTTLEPLRHLKLNKLSFRLYENEYALDNFDANTFIELQNWHHSLTEFRLVRFTVKAKLESLVVLAI
jgi:hypothetical protein